MGVPPAGCWPPFVPRGADRRMRQGCPGLPTHNPYALMRVRIREPASPCTQAGGAVLASPSVDPPIRWEHDRGLGTVWVALPAGVPLGPGNGTFKCL